LLLQHEVERLQAELQELRASSSTEVEQLLRDTQQLKQ
jgi:uncharacterized small protein (DUF1192 family)